MKKQLLTLIGLLAFGTASMAQVPSYVPTNGLVGWWPFNGNANDESGNGNNGTVNGATLTLDRDGNSNAAYAFDGTQYISVDHSSSLSVTTGQLSISCWSRRLGSGTFQHLVSKQDFTSGPYTSVGYYLRYHGSDYAFACGTETITNASIAAACPSPTDWNHVVLVYDEAQNSTKMYVNGSLELTVANQNSNSITSTDNLYFGVEHPIISLPSGPQYLTGEMDDIGIWNVALTEEQITDLYEAVDGPCLVSSEVSYTGLDASYSLSDGAATLVGSPAGGVFFGEGVSGNQFDPSAAGVGTHSIVYTYVDESGCVGSYGLCTTVDIGVNIEGVNIGIEGGIDVYPNPSKGQYSISVENVEGIVDLNVVDATGREVYSKSMVLGGQRSIHQIDLSSFANGVYTLSVRTAKGSMAQKLIKE